MSSQNAKVLKTTPLEDSDAKWVGLKAIEWVDPTGKQRKWESADRKTRKGDVDAVAIMTIIHRPSSEPHILLISQYRPPVGKSCIEMPAGLIDAGEEGDEGTNRAALRELEEETGYGTDKEGGKVTIEETTPTMFNDPGLTGANMKMVVVNIQLNDDSQDPVAKPEEGEFIEKYLVPVKGLYQSLKGEFDIHFLAINEECITDQNYVPLVSIAARLPIQRIRRRCPASSPRHWTRGRSRQTGSSLISDGHGNLTLLLQGFE